MSSAEAATRLFPMPEEAREEIERFRRKHRMTVPQLLNFLHGQGLTGFAVPTYWRQKKSPGMNFQLLAVALRRHVHGEECMSEDVP
jgi:hypothetical protein